MPASTLESLLATGVELNDPSRVGDFIQCPRYFKWRHQRGLVRTVAKPRYGLEFGIAMHLARAHWLQHKDLAAASDIFKTQFTPFEEPPGITRTGKEQAPTYTVMRGLVLLTAYTIKYAPDKRRILEIEGTPMIEVPLAEELCDGIYLCGKLDSVFIDHNDNIFFSDLKTTKYTDNFCITPNRQFQTYKHLCTKLLGQPVSGEIDVIGVNKTKDSGAALYRQPFEYGDFHMQEWRNSMAHHINHIAECRAADDWPQAWNCRPFFSECAYAPLCASPSAEAAELLTHSMYTVEWWDPFATGE